MSSVQGSSNVFSQWRDSFTGLFKKKSANEGGNLSKLMQVDAQRAILTLFANTLDNAKRDLQSKAEKEKKRTLADPAADPLVDPLAGQPQFTASQILDALQTELEKNSLSIQDFVNQAYFCHSNITQQIEYELDVLYSQFLKKLLLTIFGDSKFHMDILNKLDLIVSSIDTNKLEALKKEIDRMEGESKKLERENEDEQENIKTHQRKNTRNESDLKTTNKWLEENEPKLLAIEDKILKLTKNKDSIQNQISKYKQSKQHKEIVSRLSVQHSTKKADRDALVKTKDSFFQKKTQEQAKEKPDADELTKFDEEIAKTKALIEKIESEIKDIETQIKTSTVFIIEVDNVDEVIDRFNRDLGVAIHELTSKTEEKEKLKLSITDNNKQITTILSNTEENNEKIASSKAKIRENDVKIPLLKQELQIKDVEHSHKQIFANQKNFHKKMVDEIFCINIKSDELHKFLTGNNKFSKFFKRTIALAILAKSMKSSVQNTLYENKYSNKNQIELLQKINKRLHMIVKKDPQKYAESSDNDLLKQILKKFEISNQSIPPNGSPENRDEKKSEDIDNFVSNAIEIEFAKQIILNNDTKNVESHEMNEIINGIVSIVKSSLNIDRLISQVSTKFVNEPVNFKFKKEQIETCFQNAFCTILATEIYKTIGLIKPSEIISLKQVASEKPYVKIAALVASIAAVALMTVSMVWIIYLGLATVKTAGIVGLLAPEFFLQTSTFITQLALTSLVLKKLHQNKAA